jgi:hypothetical protein
LTNGLIVTDIFKLTTIGIFSFKKYVISLSLEESTSVAANNTTLPVVPNARVMYYITLANARVSSVKLYHISNQSVSYFKAKMGQRSERKIATGGSSETDPF